MARPHLPSPQPWGLLAWAWWRITQKWRAVNLVALERSIAEGMRAGNVPGLALAVVKDREVVYARGFGVTNAEEGGQAVTPETLFRIASTTKP